jgi:hypothetical protein
LDDLALNQQYGTGQHAMFLQLIDTKYVAIRVHIVVLAESQIQFTPNIPNIGRTNYVFCDLDLNQQYSQDQNERYVTHLCNEEENRSILRPGEKVKVWQPRNMELATQKHG